MEVGLTSSLALVPSSAQALTAPSLHSATPSSPRCPQELGSMDEDCHLLLFQRQTELSSGAVGTTTPGCYSSLRHHRHTHLLSDVPSSASQGQGRGKRPSCDFFLSGVCEDVENTMEESDQPYQAGLWLSTCHESRACKEDQRQQFLFVPHFASTWRVFVAQQFVHPFIYFFFPQLSNHIDFQSF